MNDAQQTASQAEAARYALLRRLAPSMRHHLVVNLQPIGMICEVLDRRLRAPVPDLAHVQDGAQKINGFARAALGSCLDVVTWLAPEEGAATSVEDGVRECFGMLATSLGFRGYTLRSEVGEAGRVRRSAIRNVLSAALLHTTDENPPPAGLSLTARALDRGVELTLSLAPQPGGGGFANEPGYRAIGWADLQALAQAESVELVRDGGQRISLVLPFSA